MKRVLVDAGPLVAYFDRDSTVLTLDRDFRVYRRNGRQVIPVISPD